MNNTEIGTNKLLMFTNNKPRFSGDPCDKPLVTISIMIRLRVRKNISTKFKNS